MSTDYQTAYDEAMAKLEATATGAKPAAETTSEATPEAAKAADATAKPETPDYAAEIEKLRKEQESTTKALKDTKAAFTRTSQQLAEMKRAKEAEQHQAQRPAILDANPGLEEAIKHVVPAAQPDPLAQVAGAIETALPDLEGMLVNDAVFKAKIDAARPADGAWANPLIAIRDISAVRAEYIRDTAVASARADFAKKSGKLAAMEVDGGSGSNGGSQPEKPDAVKAVWDMPKADFDRMRAKALGYS
jgi:chromosome segregation ATPase